MIAVYPVIPYVKQSDTPGERTCGAACLSMVYGSLGLEGAAKRNLARRFRSGILLAVWRRPHT